MLERNILDDNLTLSAYVLRQRLEGREPTIGLVLGSGLNPLANEIADAASIPYAEVPRMKTSTAESHVGRFVCGTLGGKCVLAMQGRLHAYEGNSAQEVAYPVWLMERLGVRTLITTNAAGALNPNYEVGDFCIMADQINFTGRNPIAAPDPANLSDRFFSMLDAFDPELRAIAHDVAAERGVRVPRACAWKRARIASRRRPRSHVPFVGRRYGGDERVREVIAARHVGMRVLGISLVSDMGCGIGAQAHGTRGAGRGEDARGRFRAPDHGHRRAAVVGGEPLRGSGCEERRRERLRMRRRSRAGATRLQQ